MSVVQQSYKNETLICEAIELSKAIVETVWNGWTYTKILAADSIKETTNVGSIWSILA